jgi:predicted nucleic acid-binding protein
MSAVVIDSSIVPTWCFEDEASAETDMLFERVRDDGAAVPGSWHLELSNVLLQAEKRGRVDAGDLVVRLDLIAELPLLTQDRELADAAKRLGVVVLPDRGSSGPTGARSGSAGELSVLPRPSRA